MDITLHFDDATAALRFAGALNWLAYNYDGLDDTETYLFKTASTAMLTQMGLSD